MARFKNSIPPHPIAWVHKPGNGNYDLQPTHTTQILLTKHLSYGLLSTLAAGFCLTRSEPTELTDSKSTVSFP